MAITLTETRYYSYIPQSIERLMGKITTLFWCALGYSTESITRHLVYQISSRSLHDSNQNITAWNRGVFEALAAKGKLIDCIASEPYIATMVAITRLISEENATSLIDDGIVRRLSYPLQGDPSGLISFVSSKQDAFVAVMNNLAVDETVTGDHTRNVLTELVSYLPNNHTLTADNIPQKIWELAPSQLVTYLCRKGTFTKSLTTDHLLTFAKFGSANNIDDRMALHEMLRFFPEGSKTRIDLETFNQVAAFIRPVNKECFTNVFELPESIMRSEFAKLNETAAAFMADRVDVTFESDAARAAYLYDSATPRTLWKKVWKSMTPDQQRAYQADLLANEGAWADGSIFRRLEIMGVDPEGVDTSGFSSVNQFKWRIHYKIAFTPEPNDLDDLCTVCTTQFHHHEIAKMESLVWTAEFFAHFVANSHYHDILSAAKRVSDEVFVKYFADNQPNAALLVSEKAIECKARLADKLDHITDPALKHAWQIFCNVELSLGNDELLAVFRLTNFPQDFPRYISYDATNLSLTDLDAFESLQNESLGCVSADANGEFRVAASQRLSDDLFIEACQQGLVPTHNLNLYIPYLATFSEARKNGMVERLICNLQGEKADEHRLYFQIFLQVEVIPSADEIKAVCMIPGISTRVIATAKNITWKPEAFHAFIEVLASSQQSLDLYGYWRLAERLIEAKGIEAAAIMLLRALPAMIRRVSVFDITHVFTNVNGLTPATFIAAIPSELQIHALYFLAQYALNLKTDESYPVSPNDFGDNENLKLLYADVAYHKVRHYEEWAAYINSTPDRSIILRILRNIHQVILTDALPTIEAEFDSLTLSEIAFNRIMDNLKTSITAKNKERIEKFLPYIFSSADGDYEAFLSGCNNDQKALFPATLPVQE